VTVRRQQTRDGYPIREGKGVMAGPADTFIAYGESWATVSNTPFHVYKHRVHEGNKAVLEGDWKLVAKHDKPWELFDLSKDRSEQNDLSSVEAQRAQRMAAMWDT
jgi:arylsulfatase A-like enzyme